MSGKLSNREYQYRWTWELRSSPEAFWPYIADTNRFDYDRGNGGLELMPGERLPNARLRLRLSFLQWVEEPFEWVRPYRYGVNRRFRAGPMDELRLLAELTARPDGGTRLVYRLWVTPRNILGNIFIPLLIGQFSYPRFDAAVRKYDRMALEGSRASPLVMTGLVRFRPGGGERLAALR